jgi:hypothetical protein
MSWDLAEQNRQLSRQLAAANAAKERAEEMHKLAQDSMWEAVRAKEMANEQAATNLQCSRLNWDLYQQATARAEQAEARVVALAEALKQINKQCLCCSEVEGIE